MTRPRRMKIAAAPPEITNHLYFGGILSANRIAPSSAVLSSCGGSQASCFSISAPPRHWPPMQSSCVLSPSDIVQRRTVGGPGLLEELVRHDLRAQTPERLRDRIPRRPRPVIREVEWP